MNHLHFKRRNMEVKQKISEKSVGLSHLLLALHCLATRIPKIILSRIEEEFPEVRSGTVKLPESQESCLGKIEVDIYHGEEREYFVISRSKNVQKGQSQCPNMCYVCNRNFRDENVLKLHLVLHNSDLRNCKDCDELCDDIFKLNEHYKMHWQNWKYACKVCGRKFQTSYHLGRHKAVHSTIFFHCKICNKRFRYISNLRRHYSAHSEEWKFVCDICNKTFKLKYHIRQHMVSHKNEKHLACSICNKHFKRITHLRTHISTVHLLERKYDCIKCGKKYKRSHHLKRHIMAIHRGEKHVCHVCNATFAYKHTFQYHWKSHF